MIDRIRDFAEEHASAALLVAAYLAAMTLLGVTVYDDVTGNASAMSEPDTPLAHSDPTTA